MAQDLKYLLEALQKENTRVNVERNSAEGSGIPGVISGNIVEIGDDYIILSDIMEKGYIIPFHAVLMVTKIKELRK